MRRIVFYLLLSTIPIQLGKHFWPAGAFVNGIRLDYLSPTLYLSDIFIIVLFLLSFQIVVKAIFQSKIILFTLVTLIIGSFFSTSHFQSFIGFIKLFEVLFLAFYCSEYFTKKDIPNTIFIFALGGIVESLILLFQFLSQSSIGGLFYYLGERTFSASTPGISLFNFGQNLILRPYGTFPHPNVASFYLLSGFTMLLFTLKFRKRAQEIIKSAALVGIVIGILLTFSRISIVLVFVILIIRLLTLGKSVSKKKIFSMFWGSILIGAIIFMALFERFENHIIRDINLRIELVKISLSIFMSNPIFGVGLNNFFFHEVVFQKTITPILLQPVHNIYLYWLVQTGIFGLIPLIYLLFKISKAAGAFIKYNLNKNSFYTCILVMVGAGLVIGLFDHYPISLQQGQLLSAILIGIIFSRSLRKFKV